MAKRRVRETLPPFKEVIQVPLMPEMVTQVTALVATQENLSVAWVKLAEEGFVCSVAPNPFGGFTASIRSAQEGSPNAGLQFYGNAPSAMEAIAVCLVKLDFLSTTSDWKKLATATPEQLYR